MAASPMSETTWRNSSPDRPSAPTRAPSTASSRAADQGAQDAARENGTYTRNQERGSRGDRADTSAGDHTARGMLGIAIVMVLGLGRALLALHREADRVVVEAYAMKLVDGSLRGAPVSENADNG